MDIKTIEKQVIEIIEDISTIKVANDAPHQLLSELNMDSLCMVMLLVMIEDVFEIELDESDMNPFLLLTVQDAIDLVAKYKIESGCEKNG